MHVLAELKRLNAGIEKGHEADDEIKTKISSCQSEIASLKVKSGIWGAFSGILTGVGVALLATFGKS